MLILFILIGIIFVAFQFIVIQKLSVNEMHRFRTGLILIGLTVHRLHCGDMLLLHI